MEAIAIARYVRMSAYKIRRVLSLIKNKTVKEAVEILKYMPGAAAPRVYKVLMSAQANLNKKQPANIEDVIIIEAIADEGPTMKRIISRSQGRTEQIKKRTCHIKIRVQN